MSGISRATLPSEFFDRTSERMLRAPEPQYIWARLGFMSNAQAELRRPGAAEFAAAGRAAMGGSGADVPELKEMQLLIGDEIRSEAILTSDELAPGKVGHTIMMNRPVFANTTYTEASRTIGSNDTIDTTPVQISGEQVAVTIRRVAGPYNSTTSKVGPYSIDRFDAEHSVHSIAATAGLHLSRDRMKYFDSAISSKFFLTTPSTIVFPGDSTFSFTSDTLAFPTGAGVGSRPFDYDTLVRMEQKADEAGIPMFANGKRMLVLSAAQAAQLKLDRTFRQLAVFDSDLNPLKTALVGVISNTEVYVSTTNPTLSVNSNTVQRGVMFGPGAVGYANAGPCRVAATNEDNFGETAKVIWICYEGLATLDNRFMVEVHSA